MGAHLEALAELDPRWPDVLRKAQQFEYFAPWLKIRPEDGGRLIKFKQNTAQQWIGGQIDHERRVLLLKARRLGITTRQLAKGIHRIWKDPYIEGLMLAHKSEDATTIFQAGQIMDDNLPHALRHHRPTTNKREIYYDLMGSRLGIGTAGGLGVRRGSALQFVHMTEAAFYKGDVDLLVAGLNESARAGQMIAETTANGAGGWFYDTWMANRGGDGEWKCVFAPWWLDERNTEPMTPEEIRAFKMTKDEREYFKHVKLSPPQVMWYRRKLAILGRLMKQEYPSSDLEAFAVTGRHYYDQEIVVALSVDLPRAVEVWDGTCGRIWEQPEDGVKYVIGADTSEGTQTGDFSYASVHRFDNGDQVARYRKRITPPSFAAVLAKLGRRFNNAKIAVERNQPECLRVLRKGQEHKGVKIPGYRNLWHRRSPSTKKKDPVAGWLTNTQTRPLMHSHLKDALEGDREAGYEGWLVLRDPVVFGEMQSFEEQSSGKYEAPPGKHDDGIDAVAIALQARQQPNPTLRYLDL